MTGKPMKQMKIKWNRENIKILTEIQKMKRLRIAKENEKIENIKNNDWDSITNEKYTMDKNEKLCKWN